MTLTGRSLRIQRVKLTDPQQVEEVLALPYRLHSRYPQWAPVSTLEEERRRLTPGRHPFWEHSDAACFAALRGREVVGRILVMEHRRFIAYTGRRAGLFGMFECEDDPAIAEALFDASFDWMAARGLDEVIGPRGFGGDAGGLLVEGFEHQAVAGVTWNPQWYEPLVRDAGLEPAEDYLSGWFPGDHVLDARIHAIAARAVRVQGFEVVGFATRRQLARWAPRVVPVVIASMAELGSFAPPTQRETADLVRILLAIADPRAIKVVTKDAEPVGFLLAYPDLAPALRRVEGRVTPMGWAHLLNVRRHTKDFVINGLGVLPEYRGLGVNAVLYTALTRALKYEIGFRRAEVVQVSESNAASSRDMAALGVHWYKRHRSYRRPL